MKGNGTEPLGRTSRWLEESARRVERSAQRAAELAASTEQVIHQAECLLERASISKGEAQEVQQDANGLDSSYQGHPPEQRLPKETG